MIVELEFFGSFCDTSLPGLGRGFVATVALLAVAVALSLPTLYGVGEVLIAAILLASALSVPKASTTSLRTAAVYGCLVGLVVGASAATAAKAASSVASAALVVMGTAVTCGAITAMVYALEKKFMGAASGGVGMPHDDPRGSKRT